MNLANKNSIIEENMLTLLIKSLYYKREQNSVAHYSMLDFLFLLFKFSKKRAVL